MLRTITLLSFGTLLFAAGFALAQQHNHGGGKVSVVSSREVEEQVDGKAANVTTLEINYGPGEHTPPHRHPGAVYGYVLEGEFETALKDEPVKKLKAGDTFYEPKGILHRVSRNPSDKNRTRFIAIMVHPRDAKELVTLEPSK